MEYMKIGDVAVQWGVTPRRVQALCAAGRIEGAVRFGRDWMIPRGAVRPADGRTKIGRREDHQRHDTDMPLPRKTPFLYMSDLYSQSGTAADCAAQLADNHEAQVLFEAEVAYSRGEIDRVYESANYLLNKHSGFYAIQSAGMLLALCAIWRGDLAMWRRAKLHIAEAPAKSDMDREIALFSITAVDSMLYDVRSFPEWFKMGCFEPLPRDALPAAKVYYAKYLYATAFALATRRIDRPDMPGLSLMKALPYTIEPMISQAMADHSLIAEIYLRMTCAVVYHTIGNEERAAYHVDRAVSLALPDRLYGLLAEYCRLLETLLEQRIVAVSPTAWEEVRTLHKVYSRGWSGLIRCVRGHSIVTTLSRREWEVAKLAAFGLSNAEIAEKLHMSLSGVKQAVRIVSEKTGVGRREFAAYL